MNNTQLILKFKIYAKERYEFLTETYETTKEAITKTNRKVIKAQITIWAGVYNRDYKEYRKGVDNFKELSIIAMKDNDKDAVNIFIKKEEDGAEVNNNYCEDFFKNKNEFYKQLYNDLPRGYFKKK